MSKRRDAIVGWVVLLGSVVSLICVAMFWGEDQLPEQAVKPEASTDTKAAREYLANAEEAFDQGAYRAARKLADTALSLDASLVDAALLAGNAAIEFEDLDKAIEYFDRVALSGKQSSIRARFGKARAQFLLGSHGVAESELRNLIAVAPNDVLANDLLAELLDVHGRRWDSVPYAIEVARQGRSSLEALVLLADSEFVINPNNRARRAVERSENDPTAKLGLARAAFDEGDSEAGRKLLSESQGVESLLLKLERTLQDDLSEFAKLRKAVPDAAKAHPRYWFAHGIYAQRTEQMEAAARCFWEAVRRDPNHRAGHFRLAQVLESLSRGDDAKRFLDRGLQLARLRKVLEPIVAAGADSNREEVGDVIVALESLGRNIEARAWEAWMQRQVGEEFDFEPIAKAVAVEQRVSQSVEPGVNVADQIDLSEYPFPEVEAKEETAATEARTVYRGLFENQAAALGIRFTYVAAPDDQTEGKRIIELTGGGVAAFDFDLDAWPDMFFTQGGLVPKFDDTLRDRLFRNTCSESGPVLKGFLDVTDLSGLGTTAYGQGMAIGDFNSDGFPDVYVGNLGQNRLFANNGDGTFIDVTSNLNDQYNDWTTSCVFADFNNDSLPDLYVANYLAGNEIQTRICRLVESAKPRMCTPDQFPAAQDRVFLNLGDGTFADRSEQSGIVLPQGKGLGVLVADFDYSNALQLFVANDGVPNFFFDIHPESFTFTDVATTVGLAMNGDGLAQACMGVAAGDLNADGRPDLFVTNFDREPNTLYVNAAGLFDDSTRQSRLHDPGFRMLGFGTQFIDGNLDGLLDLVVTNGHVDDYSHQGTAYRMRPQYFRNTATHYSDRSSGIASRGVRALSFEEVAPADVGSFFDQPQLGRGLCRIDWNRDGREDIAISHLDSAAAVLTNVSDQTGNSITLRLVGTVTNRDAIGSKVTISDGDWLNRGQLIAGDGYMCSNQRQLVFGLGDRPRVSELRVRWLDGSTQLLTNLEAGNEYLIRQGDDAVLIVPR